MNIFKILGIKRSVFISLIIFIPILLSSCSNLGKSKYFNECKQLVKDRLRSPSTAAFPEINLNNLDGKSFEIVGVVDAQNGFGATIRGSFKCMGYKNEPLRLIYVN